MAFSTASPQSWIPKWLASPRLSQKAIPRLLAIAGISAFFVVGRKWSLATQMLGLSGLLAIILTAIGCCRRWQLIGPVFFYDLVRASRRTRYFLVRTAYAAFLLALSAWLYFLWSMDRQGIAERIEANQMAAFAGSFFYSFLGMQFLLVALLTPAYTAGAIAEERERKTLELLFTTDLHSQEIVLGKLASRFLNLCLLILAGLPILSFLQFMGGVDPDLLLAGFAATGLTAASVAGLSIFYSTISKRAREAIVLTYLTELVYILISSMSWILVGPPLSWGAFPSTTAWTSPVTLQNLVEWLNAGNPISAIGQLQQGIASGQHLDETLPSLLLYYALSHGFVAVAAPFFAIRRLRAVDVRKTYAKHPKRAVQLQLAGRRRKPRQTRLGIQFLP